jgi:insulysin
VDSENQKNLQSDPWRIDQLEKSTCKPEHPFSKYGTGNLNTLKTEPEKLGLCVRKELLNFHSKYYSANLMSLCVLGKESLDELQQYVVDMFSEIENKNLKKIDFDPNPFCESTLTNIYKVVPVQDLRNLMITWTIPDYRDYYEVSPTSYITHLVGHEGEGSLLSELKKRGWCNNLYAGSRREARGFQLFNITVDLSEEGGEHINEIVLLVQQYLNMLRKSEPSKEIFDEHNDLGRIQFTFKDKEKPINYVSSLTHDMHTYAMEHLLTAKYYSTKFDANLIKSIYDYLHPSKMKIMVVSKKYENNTDLVEPWYGTNYAIEKLADHNLKMLRECGLNEAFRLPNKNEFIPSDLSLVNHNDSHELLPKLPRVVHSTNLTRLWYKEDTKFLLPKAIYKFEIRNPIVYFDPANVNMCNLFVDLLMDSLTEYAYDAELAGLKYKINTTNYGIVITLSGFSDKMDVLLKTIVERMATFKVDPQRFNILKESVSKQTKIIKK